MARLVRIDAELVRRQLARSRGEAAELIEAGRVVLDGVVVSKVARQVSPEQSIRLIDDGGPRYVSRGAHKLAGALDRLGAAAPVVAGRRALDAGASTGGFTDVLLRRGAAHVVAVDVGYGQLAWELQQDERVTVVDRTNVRYLDPAAVAPPPHLVVGDLSFISLTLVLPALVKAAAPTADFLLLVKPQFEVGREALGAGGVVREPAEHARAIRRVAQTAAELGLASHAVVASPLPGPRGNIEYFLAMRRGDETIDLDAAIARAVADRPGSR